MAFKEGHKFGKGNNNSGRKSVYEEYNKAQAINTLWEKVNKKVQAKRLFSALYRLAEERVKEFV